MLSFNWSKDSRVGTSSCNYTEVSSFGAAMLDINSIFYCLQSSQFYIIDLRWILTLFIAYGAALFIDKQCMFYMLPFIYH